MGSVGSTQGIRLIRLMKEFSGKVLMGKPDPDGSSGKERTDP